ncbi:YfjI family protein [Aeromonas hydrophila]|uniref:YfjI family protein n=1 Tax=Aeromonas hydrophila TaxID=644 RepID=UPI001FF5C8B5|nr:YfjI family protein [Aeromonas hydrophila]MCK0188233.1 YfjI family protein [Aeromonas hydrophila]UOV90712.1 YfjI family protein [Aeromonas hydrophila]
MSQFRAIEDVIERLDGSLLEPLNYVADRTKAPKFMILTQMLSVISIASQQLVDISPKSGMKMPTSLYILILAASGERKSTVDKLLMKPVREFEKWLSEQAEYAQQRYQTDFELWCMKQKMLKKELIEMYKQGEEQTTLIEAWHAHQLNKPTPPIVRRILAEDVTVAKLKSMLAGENTSLALVSDEAGTLLSSDLMKDNALFNSLWSGQTIRVDRANATEVHIEGARLTLSMQVQPKIYRAFRASNGDVMRSSGLDARILLCEPESNIGYRQEDRDDNPSFNDRIKLGRFNSRIEALLKEGMEHRKQKKQRHCLKLTDMAKDVWQNKFNDIEYAMRDGECLERYRDFGSKFMEQASRIAAVLHIFKHTNYSCMPVNHETMEISIRLTEIYLHQALIIFRAPEVREFVDQTHVNKLLEWIIQNRRGELILKSDIRRSGPHCVRNLDKLEDAIEVLIARGDIRCFKRKQSIYIALSWDKYPTLVRRTSLCTRDGIYADDLVEYFGRHCSRIPSIGISRRPIIDILGTLR